MLLHYDLYEPAQLRSSVTIPRLPWCYRVSGLNYDRATQEGSVFNYSSFGSACSVVEIDCLIGDHQVLSTDIVMDVGKSLNPAIDIGQIEGGFMQV